MERTLISVEGINVSYCSEIASAVADRLNQTSRLFGRKAVSFDFGVDDDTFFGAMSRFCEDGGLGTSNNSFLQGLLYISDYMESASRIREAFDDRMVVVVSPYVGWASSFHAGRESSQLRSETVFYQLEMSAFRFYSVIKPSHSFFIKDDPDSVRHLCYGSGKVKSAWKVTTAQLQRAQAMLNLRAEKGLPWITIDAHDKQGRRKLAITVADAILSHVIGSGYSSADGGRPSLLFYGDRYAG